VAKEKTKNMKMIFPFKSALISAISC